MIQNGYGGANGSGYLADIHFHAFGPVCETSFINFSGHCVLLDTEGNKIPATWQNATVHVSPPPEWTPMDSGTTAYLWGIWGTNSSDVFALLSVRSRTRYPLRAPPCSFDSIALPACHLALVHPALWPKIGGLLLT